jgi:subtilisin
MKRDAFKAIFDKDFDSFKAGATEPVDVAVVDSGVDSTHADLKGQVKSSFVIKPVEDRHEIETVAIPCNNDAYGHGTGVAGIIASIAHNAHIHDIRVLDEHCSSTGATLLQGFHLAIENKYRVINLSLASTAKFASQLQELCEKAYRQNQIVVAAKRNMPLVDNGFPAEFSSCIAVDIGDFSSPFIFNYRSDNPIEYVARGEAVRTTAIGGGYTEMSGTSFATPTIAGIVALILGSYPDLRLFELKTILKAFAVQENEHEGGPQ